MFPVLLGYMVSVSFSPSSLICRKICKSMWLIEKNLNVLTRPISHDCALISCTCTRRRHSRGSISTPHQSIQTEALKGSKEGVVVGRGRFPPGSVALPWEAVMAPEVSFPDSPFSILLGQHSLLTFPFPLQFILVSSEPGVWHFLAVAGNASPPADAPPAGKAASPDRLAPPGAPLGGAFPRHAAGELLQGSAQ